MPPLLRREDGWLPGVMEGGSELRVEEGCGGLCKDSCDKDGKEEGGGRNIAGRIGEVGVVLVFVFRSSSCGISGRWRGAPVLTTGVAVVNDGGCAATVEDEDDAEDTGVPIDCPCC